MRARTHARLLITIAIVKMMARDCGGGRSVMNEVLDELRILKQQNKLIMKKVASVERGK